MENLKEYLTKKELDSDYSSLLKKRLHKSKSKQSPKTRVVSYKRCKGVRSYPYKDQKHQKKYPKKKRG